jgi:glycosyltransferase involved in cell wall biosynthesis
MAEDARSVDAFVAVSRYYADAVAPRLRVPPSRLHVVRIGICLEGYGPGERPNPPVVGYLGRAGCGLGLRTLAEAFVALARDARCREVRLRVAGGSTQDDAPLLADVRRHLDAAGVGDRVEFLANLTRADRQAFLRSITLLCVPAEHPPAFGMSLLEALACAVPVVQPREGGFEEIVEIAGGGVLYAPNTAHALAGTLAAVLADPAGLQRLGEQGREGVRRHFSAERMAEDMLKVLDELVAGRPGSGRQEGASV